MSDRVLTRRELNRAILERQMLLRRAPASPIEVMERLVGMQAQVPGDPYVALWSRIEGFEPDQLSQLIATRRAVRVVTLLRSTIHLTSDRDCLAIRAVLQPMVERLFGYSPFARALAGVDVHEVVAAGRTILAEGPQTISEIGRRLARRWPDRDAAALGYAVRYLVPMVQVPPRGLWGRSGQPRLESVERWLDRPLDGSATVDDLVMRYLGAFGPASVKDVQVWSYLSGVREVIDRLRPRLRTFRDEQGRELFDVPDGPLPDPETPAPVRFLPEYDNLYLSHHDRSRVGGPAFRQREWMKGSFSVDGFLAGTWRMDTKSEETVLRIGSFGDLTDVALGEVEAEASAVMAFAAPHGMQRRLEVVDLRD